MSGVGPDRVLPADSFTSVQPDVPVKLRTTEQAPDDSIPYSVPTLLTNVAKRRGDGLALAVKRTPVAGGEPEWVKWSYKDYLRDVRSAAKGMIKLGLDRR